MTQIIHHMEREKYSTREQWQEKVLPPTLAHFWSPKDVEQHRKNLVACAKCDDGDITHFYESIKDWEEDEDRDDCIWLKYKQKCVVAGVAEERIIYRKKVPIPDETKALIAKMRSDKISRRNVNPKPDENTNKIRRVAKLSTQ